MDQEFSLFHIDKIPTLHNQVCVILLISKKSLCRSSQSKKKKNVESYGLRMVLPILVWFKKMALVFISHVEVIFKKKMKTINPIHTII